MGLRSQTPAMKMRAYIRALLFTIELKSAVSKKRFIMNFKLLMDRYKHVERSISNVPPTHSPHNIMIPSLLDSSSEEGEELEEEEEADIMRTPLWLEVSGSSASEGEGSSGSGDINIEAAEFIRRNRERMMMENREDFDGISEC